MPYADLARAMPKWKDISALFSRKQTSSRVVQIFLLFHHLGKVKIFGFFCCLLTNSVECLWHKMPEQSRAYSFISCCCFPINKRHMSIIQIYYKFYHNKYIFILHPPWNTLCVLERDRMLRLKLDSPTANGNPEAEFDESLRFLRSLQELRELRSQIHCAADYCEKSYLNAEDKSLVVDNTKEYLCRAVVTVVDHLGSVSANLNHQIEKSDRVSETEMRINCLKQKLDSCDQYNHNFTPTKIRWSTDLPRYHLRYISPPANSSDKESSLQPREPSQLTDGCKDGKQEFKTDEDMPIFMYTTPNKISLDISPTSPLEIDAKGITVMPVRDGFSVVPKLPRNHSFHFQESRKIGGLRRLLQWKTMSDNEFISAFRRSKKEPSRLLLKLKS